MRKLLILNFTLCLLLLPVSAQKQGPESQVKQFLANFILAFDDLDWEQFRQSFSDDATVFYPRSVPERANGRAEFEKHFKVVFEQIRAGRTNPPFMDIQPHDMKMQMYSDVAIVSFHLDDRPGFVNRRTIVLRNTSHGWKIIHLHASEVPIGR